MFFMDWIDKIYWIINHFQGYTYYSFWTADYPDIITLFCYFIHN